MGGRGDLGTKDVRKQLNGSRVNFKPLDEDPDGLKEGDAWVRGDITSGDRIGTFRFYDGESIRSAGVFDPSNLEAGEEGFLRIPLGSTVGVVPALSPQDAYIGELRARHGGQVYGLGREPAIPDSEGLHARFDFSEYDASATSNISDLSGNGHTLDEGSISGYTTINGVQAGQFDPSSNDTLYGPSFSDIEPATVYVVAELAATDANQYLLQLATDGTHRIEWRDGGPWRLSKGTNTITGSSDGTIQLVAGVLETSGTNSVLREEGTETASGDVGSDAIETISLGSRQPGDSGAFWDGAIGEVLIYDSAHDSQTIGEVESYLANKWGVSLA